MDGCTERRQPLSRSCPESGHLRLVRFPLSECDAWPAVAGVSMPLVADRVHTYLARSKIRCADLPLIVCVCGGPATRGTDNAYRGGCTVDTTAGGGASVTRAALRPRRPPRRRSRRCDRLLPGAGPCGRRQGVSRGGAL